MLARLLQAGTPWSDHLHFDPDQRWFRRVGEQDGHDVWLLSLMPGQGTGLHDHVGSSGAFGVISGALTEVTVRGRGAGLTIDWVRWTAGEVRLVPRGRVHQLRNDTVARAVSLHVYSPMLTVTTEYAVRAEGLVRVAEERDAW